MAPLRLQKEEVTAYRIQEKIPVIYDKRRKGY